MAPSCDAGASLANANAAKATVTTHERIEITSKIFRNGWQQKKEHNKQLECGEAQHGPACLWAVG
jgi:hypothetical protein